MSMQDTDMNEQGREGPEDDRPDVIAIKNKGTLAIYERKELLGRKWETKLQSDVFVKIRR